MIKFEELLERQQALLQTEVLTTQTSLKTHLDALLNWASFYKEPTVQLAQEALARPLPTARGWPSLTVQLADKVDLLVEWETYHQLLQTAQAELVRHVEEPLRTVLLKAAEVRSLAKTRYSSLTKGWLPISMPPPYAISSSCSRTTGQVFKVILPASRPRAQRFRECGRS